jgi:GAF domain-containing protein
MVIEDAGAVAALKKNLALRYMNIHAYAGIPITASGGEAIGSFCALDSTPRKWTTEELATLKDLAAITEAYLHRKPTATVARRAVESAKAIGRRFSGRLQASERDALKAIITEQRDFLGG